MDNANLKYDAVVIGGGFFGCSLAMQLRRKYKNVVIIEMSKDILERASYVNQARVHNGYHYPRSLLTAMRSRVNFPRFVHDYADCIYSDFEQYYAVARNFSKVTANQFRIFMDRIGAEIKPAPKWIKQLTNPGLVEDIFTVKEYAFDATKLRNQIRQDLLCLNIDLLLWTKASRLSPNNGGGIDVHFNSFDIDRNHGTITAPKVYNCTYSHINQVLVDSHMPALPLKHEITEMALIDLPEELREIGITLMCGPFFSFMPFPSTNFHTLSHVRYTPHLHWIDSNQEYHDTYQYLNIFNRKSQSSYMLKDAQRYIPLLSKSRYVDSLWEIKTVLPTSEVDDSRPIMIKKDYGIPGLTCILGGKIDNIYDVFDELEGELN